MDNKIIIGARGSKLSLTYANKVKELILDLNEAKEKTIDIKVIKTSGDHFSSEKISEIGGKNLFCKEIEDELIKNTIDIAVHSLKDMAAIEREELNVRAYIKRNDPRESFISFKHDKLSEINSGNIGSSSRRRELQVKLLNENARIVSIRGNVDTRIKKIKDGEYEGAILALAGVRMLNLEKYVKEVFPIEIFLPAIGQGIIAVQCRKNDKKIENILKKINHDDTKICALSERSFLKTIGGDCHTAVGGYAKLENNIISLKVQLFSDDGKKVFNLEKKGKFSEAELLGKKIGNEILKIAGGSFKKKNEYNFN